MNYSYKVSVVMSVYNVEKFIEEAVESIINQDIGFKDIQIVFVDDGSTDNSGKICDVYADKYPNNVVVVHKKNEGLAKARVSGIKLAKGKYLSFFDPDDTLTSNSFTKMYNFFEKHYHEIDVVAMPMFFFGDKKGAHPLNYKFREGTRVIDLFDEFNAVHLSFASSFIKNDISHLIGADSELVTAEDAKEMVKLLLLKNKLGVVREARYNYRRRESSSVMGATTKKGWYTTYIDNFTRFSIKYANEKMGYVPKYIQYMVMYDLQWKFRLTEFPPNLFSREEEETVIANLYDVLHCLDDEIIMGQRFLSQELKIHIINKKYKNKYSLCSSDEDVEIKFCDDTKIPCSKIGCKIEFIKINKNNLFVDGMLQLYGGVRYNDVFIKINNQFYKAETFDRYEENKSLGEKITENKGFRINIPLDIIREKTELFIYLDINDTLVRMQRFLFGNFSPIKSYKYSYYVSNNYKITFKNNKFIIAKTSNIDMFISECKFLKELWLNNRNGSRMAVFARLAYNVLNTLKRKPLWLISDRAVKADDNGLAFFIYLQKYYPEINSYFVISENCDDFKKVKGYGPVLKRDSLKHKLYVLLSDYVISSHAEVEIYNPFTGHDSPYRNILANNKFIFLQHGITQNNLTGWLNKYKKNIYGFVTAAILEHKSIFSKGYYYGDSNVWLVGFPRFDRLYNDEKRQITIMPTWRRYLMDRWIREEDRWVLKSDFKESNYYKFYNSIINNEKFINYAKERGYCIKFFPHPNLQDHVNIFKKNKDVEFLSRETDYKDIYANSNIIISDYSSAVFDFSYLRKPIIYAQFDKDEFFAGEHVFTKGYFDYERDGFGEVEYTLEGTVDRIIEYIDNDCQLKDKYRERIDNFFAFDDKKNCQRLYERILEAERDMC